MSEPRRGAVVLIRRGDPEITAAIASGMLAGAASAEPVEPETVAKCPETAAECPETEEKCPETEGKCPETAHECMEIVTATADRERVVAQLVRVAVGNDKTAEDYRMMTVTARRLYATPRRPGPLRWAAARLLVAWATLWQGIRCAYRTQDALLGRPERGRRHG